MAQGRLFSVRIYVFLTLTDDTAAGPNSYSYASQIILFENEYPIKLEYF